MNRRYARAHLSPQVVLRSAATNAGRERTSTADLLADLADIDERKHYLALAYPSLAAYCMGELRLSEDSACRRIQAARAARRFPAIFDAVADGRLHLTAVCLLSPHLTEETACELLSAAAHRSRAEIQRFLAERFPQSDVFTWVLPTGSGGSNEEHAPAHVEGSPDASQPALARVQSVHDVAKVTPLSSQSYALQVTVDAEIHDDLLYAQALLGHRVRSGELAQVLGTVLKIAIRQLEKQKFAATDRPRASHRTSANPRHIPARVKQAVWERDGGQCTFVSEDGHRCPADSNLEFDHVLEVARGGEATVEGIRLLCRAHNQYAAERTFGAEFMRHKRIAAAEARAAARHSAAAHLHPVARQKRAPESHDEDVVPWLRALGFNAAEARRAAERCEGMADAPIEERVRLALTSFRPPCTRVERPAIAVPPA